ncbi:MAG: CZB domain-containing protein [Nitrospirae bacterium]|nr:CZB domain-containing protein [Nitrospirota bacterium]MBI3593742.1 CZB domain-containing protein [Nitrospirota bacterium]
MNFDDAINAHSIWKLKLMVYLKNPDKSIKSDEIEMDNLCVLGKWIYGDGKKHECFPEYEVLKIEHKKFHRAAAEVVVRADAGQNVTEAIALGGASPYSEASNAVIRAIIKMKNRCKN